MLIPNHPDDERLSALASRDTDAIADAELTTHVASCIRCTELVDELGALRLALADLPDLAPSRPLQLVPPVEADHAGDRLGGWARRFFAPVLVSGAALVLVGVIGTASPSLGGMGQSGAAAPQQEAAVGSSLEAERDSAAPSEPAATRALVSASDSAAAPGAYAGGEAASSEAPVASDEVQTLQSDGGLAEVDIGTDREETSATQTDLAADRSPWPMVLFAGVALIVAALLMRWILAPRSA